MINLMNLGLAYHKLIQIQKHLTQNQIKQRNPANLTIQTQQRMRQQLIRLIKSIKKVRKTTQIPFNIKKLPKLLLKKHKIICKNPRPNHSQSKRVKTKTRKTNI
jgi:hypothetical protein